MNENFMWEFVEVRKLLFKFSASSEDILLKNFKDLYFVI